ncbi:MAG: nucleotidyltransferase family protein [Anaerorhabdus sp.]
MKICGIIVEYNPLHNGHIHHIQQAKKLTQCDVLVAVMSGNFVQRGEPAITDKWQRATWAIQQGVDCVFELPYSYATQSASNFAKGAINCLKLANVDSVVFGSESNNLEELLEMASLNIQPDHIKEQMTKGLSFPKSYGLLAKEMGPNDILAISYLREIQNTTIQPLCIQRTVHYHDETLYTSISSASAIRKAYFNKESIAFATPFAEQLTQLPCCELSDYYAYLRYLLITLPPSYLNSIFLFSEGIENHLKKQAFTSASFSEFLNRSTTRRYTTSRIRRCCLQLLNHVTKEEISALPPLNFLRPLAFNQDGKQFLKFLKNSNITIASKFSQVPEIYRKIEYRSTETYSLALSESDRQALLKKERGGAIYIK